MKKFLLFTLLFSFSLKPAYAQIIPDAGTEAGDGFSVVETVAWFVGLPALIWFVIWLLWSIPKWRKLNFPQTGENWDPQPKN
ncbi:MAG: hypothetical protein RIS09_895 [Actinomycetota bacterium]|jgi:hypothetical protein